MFNNLAEQVYYLIQNNVKLKDFDKFASEQTEELCKHIDSYIEENNVETIYLNSGKTDKNEIVINIMKNNPNKKGLITTLSSIELCNTMTVKPNHETKKLEVTSRPTKCKHYYFYFNDEEFGLMFLKIQTWFPYNVQIYINGREYLSKLLDKNNIKYEMYNNSFSYIEDFEKSQKLADSILNKKISDSFDGLVEKINIHLPKIRNIFNHSYYWCIDQCEFATDINFKSREDLSLFYKTLVETTYFTFSSEDIYSFFGRDVNYIHTFKKGDIVSNLRNRYQGYRIKFKINNNQIKMYDKGNNLRIEVTINNPKDFKVLKTKENDETGEIVETKQWVPMGKSIANLYRYVEISKNIIKRYIEALPDINIDEVPLKEIERISKRAEINNKVYSGINILSEQNLKIFSEISKGEYLINSFTNKMIRKNIFENSEDKKTINKTTRLLSKLKAHGLIKKVANKNKYYLTTSGRKIINSILIYTKKTLLT
ncbi:MAG TPA: hypothetical protein IAB45_06690 [Candidatus Onthousia faecavium]|nr:hypothetical protein [Candidatus Onthousia faecavium]